MTKEEFEAARKLFQMAVADSDVDAILLCVNSPGGQTDMAFETHDVPKA